MQDPDPLKVRVNEELILDAGTIEETASAGGLRRFIRAPNPTLFQQVVSYLLAKSDPPKNTSKPHLAREGVATTALTIRWGSYLAVLLDRNKPLWSEVGSNAVSKISDAEMARINIEASAALAEWIDVYRNDQGLYQQLLNRAVEYLPMSSKISSIRTDAFSALAEPNIGSQLVAATPTEYLEHAKNECMHFPDRVFANALINFAWRNGPVEDIHAGAFRGYPLGVRRVTRPEEHQLMAFSSARMQRGMLVCGRLAFEESRGKWPEEILPFRLAGMLLITPSNWTLTERTRDVELAE